MRNGSMLQDEVAGADVVAGIGVDQQAGGSVAVNGEQDQPEQLGDEENISERRRQPAERKTGARRGKRVRSDGVQSRVLYPRSFGRAT